MKTLARKGLRKKKIGLNIVIPLNAMAISERIFIILFNSLQGEAVIRRFSVKKMFLEISQNSLENTSARVSFFNKTAGLSLQRY